MKSAVLFIVLVYLTFTNASLIPLNLINATVEQVRERLVQSDPLKLSDLSFTLPSNTGDISLKSFAATGFSNLVLTSVSENDDGTVQGTLGIPLVRIAADNFQITSTSLGLNATFTTIDAVVSGVTVDITQSADTGPVRLTSLSLLPQIGDISLVVSAVWNGESINLELDSESVDLVNSQLREEQDKISAATLEVVNKLLGWFFPKSL